MRNQIFRPKILHRKRIDNILSQIFEVPIFYISASMGYGKSTLVKNFLEKKKKIQTIWFDTELEENNDVWMWHKFCDSISSRDFELSEKLSKYGFPKNNMDIHEIIQIIREEMKQKTVIVFDDWYDKETSYINYLIKAIALEGIHNLHIVIISRNRPADEYIELELKQKCMIIWQTDIEFTFNETVEFFEINGITLKEKEKREVYEYTGGWTAAMYLSLLQYYNNNTFDNIPKAIELIKTAVYNKLDETTKQILLKLSTVENFTLEQASYITGDKKSNHVIRVLSSNNCFIRYDNKSKIYTLHSILRNIFEDELISSNVNINKINNTCGDWYSKKFEDIDAIKYYYKAKNFQRILDLMERNYTIDLSVLKPQIINSVFNELSAQEKINRPIAYLMYIFFSILHGKPQIGAKLLYEAKAIYERNENLKYKNQILGEVAVVESFIMFNDSRKMNEIHKKAYEFFNGGTSKIANSKMPFTFGSPHILYLYHNKKGELIKLVENFQQGVKYFIHISDGGGAGSNYLMSAEYFFETGDIYSGELFAYKALHKAKAKKQTSIVICSLFLLMRIFINNNNKNEARNNFNSLIKEYENFNIPSFLNGVEIAMGYIHGITGNLEDMPKWIKDVEMRNLPIILPVASMSYIGLGLATILKGNYTELEVLVKTMLESYELKNNIFGILYAYIFDSIAKYNLYDIREAKKPLLKAIDLARDDNIIMCFVELAPHILPILKKLEKENEYAKMLLPKCEKFNEIYEKNYRNIEKVELTARELEVMKLVDEGYKQTEISERLNIALITVKKHIAAVYSKLNIRNKTMAINLLKEKGII